MACVYIIGGTLRMVLLCNRTQRTTVCTAASAAAVAAAEAAAGWQQQRLLQDCRRGMVHCRVWQLQLHGMTQHL
jgi:hypothetical protein